jgi:molybdenum cofactor synthesis domain-containing protein
MSTAAILIIGNEILSAKVRDENGPFLARELRALGVELRRIETVPDEVPLIVDALERCRKAAQWTFTSGGIGPTHDDVTIAAVAQALGKKVVHDARILEMLTAHFGPERMNAARRRLAEVPEGASVIWTEGHLFPVITVGDLFVLPGVPSLFRDAFGMIRERLRAPPIYSRAIYFSVGEGVLAEHLDAAVAAFPGVAIGSYPRFDDCDHRVKVTFDGRAQAEVQAAAAFLLARLPADTVVREE